MPYKRKRHISLKDHPNIRPEVKARVNKLAEEWDYRPNPLAMGLLRQNTRTIGVIVPDLVTHFFSSVISGIESYASEQGYFIIISSSYESYQKEKDCIENLLNSRVEGLIVSLSYQTKDHSHFEDLVKKGIPIVFFDRVCLSDKVSTVVADNRAAAATKKLLSLPDPPDAIFGINDTVAFAAMKEIRKSGLRIPEDVGLVGFTDDYHATVVHPSLTSITHPTFEMGQAVARLFFETLEGNAAPKQVELKTRLMVRESSSP